MKEHLKYYFDTHPKSTEVFETADENLFHDEYAAKAHARNLDNKTVVRTERPSKLGDFADEMLRVMSAVATATVPTKGVDAVAPVVVEQDGTVISPGVGETSTSPVAAPQVVDDKTGKVIDPGTVDPGAPVETVVTVEKPLTTDVPMSEAEKAAWEANPSKASQDADSQTAPVKEEVKTTGTRGRKKAADTEAKK